MITITMKNQCHGRDDLIVWLQGYIRMDTRIKEKYHCLNCGRYFNERKSKSFYLLCIIHKNRVIHPRDDEGNSDKME